MATPTSAAGERPAASPSSSAPVRDGALAAPAGGAPAIALSLHGIGKRYGDFTALADVHLDVLRGEFLTLLGPSGSGKTTLLKVIAGFEPVDQGELHLHGRSLADTPPARRNIGMVFQNYALFPHMTVEQNVAFPLRMRGLERGRIRREVSEALALVELGHLGARYPGQLSGGQQQRVALARAIVFRPDLLLLDEPFGALDRKLRDTMQAEVRALQQRLQLTTIFITHDQEEALAMSDRIAVMQSGRLLQTDRPEHIYAHPRTRFVADFVGESNLLDGTLQPASQGGSAGAAPEAGAMALLTADGWRLPVGPRPQGAGQAATALIRPENLRCLRTGEDPAGSLAGTLREEIFLGSTVRRIIETASGQRLIVRESSNGQPVRHQPGEPVRVCCQADHLHLLETP